MSKDHEQYTKEFLKGQEIPTTSASGYLRGNSALAKYNPKGLARFAKAFYLAPLLFIALGMIFKSRNFGEALIFLGVFLLLAFVIYKLLKKVTQK